MASHSWDDCLRMAASTVVATESASFSYGKLRYIKDLPRSFIEVGSNLGLVERLLKHIQKALSSESTWRESDVDWIQILSGGLNESLELLQSMEAMFCEIADILDSEANIWSAIVGSYRQMVVPLGKAHRIETQMLHLLLVLRILLLCININGDYNLFGADQGLSRACEYLSGVLPSLPASDSSDFPNTSSTKPTPRSREIVSESRIPQASMEEMIKRYHWTALSWTARMNEEGLFRALLEIDNIGPDSKDKDGRTPLSWTAEGGHVKFIQLLLEMGSDLKSKDNNGRTPLSWAAENGSIEIVRVLLDHGSDPDSRDRSGRTPLSWAAGKGSIDVVEALLGLGSNPESRDSSGRTPLSWAAGKGSIDVVEALLGLGSNPESRDSSGRTSLSWAAGAGNWKVVDHLLMEGGSIESRDRTGRTPLSWAVEKGQRSVHYDLINKHKADVNSADDNGRTILSWAVEYGRESAVKQLLAVGADPNSKDNNGRAPLSWAAEQGQEDIAVILIENGAKVDHEGTSGWLPRYKDRSLAAANLQPHDTTLNVNSHQTVCAHKLHQKNGNESIDQKSSNLRAQHLCRVNMQNQVSLFCGLAGVLPPSSTEASSEIAQAIFSDRSVSISFIDDSKNLEPHDHHSNGLLLQLNQAMSGLISGATCVQQSGFCCNHFTVLTTYQRSSDQPVVHMNTVPFDTLVKLHQSIEALKDGLNDSALLQSVSISMGILSGIFGTIFPMPLSVELKLHYCSLVVQLLCLGLVLYSRAHVEGFHPIYLEEPLDKVILHGSSTDPDQVHIVVEHRELACTGQMIGGKVFVFDFRTRFQPFPVETKALLSHLSATCEEIVDCWGPGSLLSAEPAVLSEERISGLMIRGGIITRSNNEDGLFHWGQNIPSAELGLTGDFSYRERIVIGAGVDAGQGSTMTIVQSQAPPTQAIAPKDSRSQPGEPTHRLSIEGQRTAQRRSMTVTVKTGCRRNYADTWAASQAHQGELGTAPSSWKLVERSLLLQAGYQVVGQVGLAQIKQPRRPAKTAILDRWSNERNLSLLEELHGIQVSLCTGVARRVPLRVLVRDDLMEFIRSLWINGWDELEEEAWTAMASKEEFCAWTSTLKQRPERKACMDTVVDKLLIRLKDTGFDENETFFSVLGPRGQRCARVRPQGDEAWCRMLKDTEWSATFATATTTCLQAPSYWCTDYRGGQWNGIKTFSTFIFYTESGMNTTRCAETWQISDGKKYWHGEKAGEVMFVSRTRPNKVTELVLWDKPQMVLKALGSLWPLREVLVEISDMEQSGEEVLIACRYNPWL